ncbi:Rpn family recombination-promoting nuclease/putative transposase [Pedobacter sp. L105]|uniref:Rpn family recombination-promoting nuclease/putative transposase n=1 Tax=Pedobacter sp. L105 TaxID=1641871 RepID=UPI00131BD03B|nr:Rpn family recombination-promoting nuclease/putative transposase [Pedobacter sp. L105]
MEYNNTRFIDPMTDFGFKHIFGKEKNKDILIDFLNQLFKGEKEIIDLVYSPTEHGADQRQLKKVLFDLLCTGKNGEQFIIEMQRAKQPNFRDRAVFYTSRLINEQLPRGRDHWNIKLKEVHLIAILEFCFEDSAHDQYQHNVSLNYKGTGEIFYDKLFYKFIELSKFVRYECDLETDLDKWLYLLKHMGHLEKIPASLNQGIFKKVFKIAEIANLTKEEKEMFDFGIKAEWDYQNAMDYAKEIATEEGLKQGLEKGLEKGFKKGELKKALEIAGEMKKSDMSIQQIADYTKLSIAEIEKL